MVFTKKECSQAIWFDFYHYLILEYSRWYFVVLRALKFPQNSLPCLPPTAEGTFVFPSQNISQFHLDVSQFLSFEIAERARK